MKKVLYVMFAAGLLMLTACKKEESTPGQSPSNNPQEPEEEQYVGEGYYNPSMKIAEIRRDGQTAEEWNWQDDLLTYILQADSNGNMLESNSFEYDNHRLHTATMSVQGIPLAASYTYVSDKLSTIHASANGMPVADIIVARNSEDKINHMNIGVNNELLGLLAQLLGGGGFGKKGLPTKFAVTNTQIGINMLWDGENVSQQILSADINATVTLAEARQLMNLDSILGNYAALLALIPDTMPMPMQLALRDTISMTYDNQHNPYQGFLGRLDPSSLSANNVLTSVNNVSAMVTVTINSPLGSTPLPFPLPIPAGGTSSYTYTYNEAGYPVTATDSEGGVTQYIYQE